ncbi:hypothetical protein ACEQPO_22250 [Bacillus sp. SL00103]
MAKMTSRQLANELKGRSTMTTGHTSLTEKKIHFVLKINKQVKGSH